MSKDVRSRWIVLGIGVVAVAAWPAASLLSLATAADWGSDWWWYADGLARLRSGLPLYDPALLAGGLAGLDSPLNRWILTPPYVAPLLSPMLLVPEWAQVGVFIALMGLALAAALWIAWPRGLWWVTSGIIATVVFAFGDAISMQVHYANLNAAVALGVALTWAGWRRGARTSSRLGLTSGSGRVATVIVIVGLVLAAVKVVPALGLAAWLVGRNAGRDRGAALVPIVGAVAVLACLVAPVLLLDLGAISGAIASLAGAGQAMTHNNAPSLLLAPLLGPTLSFAVSAFVGLIVLALVARGYWSPATSLFGAMVGVCLLVPNLWSHWFVVPLLAGVVALGESDLVRRADAELRWLLGRARVTG